MKALSFTVANIYLLSILFVPRYISAAVRKAQRRQNDSPSGLLLTPASTTIITIADETGPDTVSFDPIVEQSTTSITEFSTLFEAPAGTAAPTLGTPNGPTVSGVIFTAPTTYPTKSQDDRSISTTGSIITQSVTSTASSTASFTIRSLTPAATSTASAAGTSGVRSVGSKHTWSAILFLPWLAAMLSIRN